MKALEKDATLFKPVNLMSRCRNIKMGSEVMEVMEARCAPKL